MKIEYFYKLDIEAKDYKSLYNRLKNCFFNLDYEKSKDKKYGIYCIYNNNNELMYVGQTKNIASRLTTHIRGKYKNAYRIDFFNCSFIGDDYLNDIENFFIEKFKPIDNIMVDLKYDINKVLNFFIDYQDINNIKIEDIGYLVEVEIYPKNGFMVNNDFSSDLEIMTNSLKGTKYE